MAGGRTYKRRVPYERLRERLVESRLPWDDDAERWSIGAVLLAPNAWARKFSGKLYAGHFYDRGHGWLWEELGTALVRTKVLHDDPDSIGDWLSKGQIQRRFREQFVGSAGKEIACCTSDCFWWHGLWYVDRVLVAAKLREAVIREAKLLGEALDRADQWESRR